MTAISSQSASVGRSVQVLPAPAGRIRQDLAGLDDRDLPGITGSLPRSSERRAAACELLVSRHRDVVWSCVRQYKRSPEPAEDLMQVGYVGLLKAINNFDPAFGCSLAAYARPCITGEIKRHFRDTRWQVHVERSLQELVLEIREATRRLIQQLGHMPANAELASYLGVSDAEIRDARRAELVLQPRPLDEPLGGQAGAASVADLIGEEDPQMEHMLAMQAVAAHWRELPPREQKILLLRFYGDMTQAQVGQQLGISQMHVSACRPARSDTSARGCSAGRGAHPTSVWPRHPAWTCPERRLATRARPISRLRACLRRSSLAALRRERPDDGQG
jgi:RNA polymerase sigma-B factor